MSRAEENLAKAKSIVLESGSWRTVSDIVECAGFADRRMYAQLKNWKAELKLFSIEFSGIELYPCYAFNDVNAYLPATDLQPILQVFNRTKSGWGLAYWFVSPNGFLSGRIPKDVFLIEPDLVLKADQDSMLGIQHG